MIMAVHYKFKSAKDYDSVAIDDHFISVGHLKQKIFEQKNLGRGTDYDLVVTNAHTNEEYLDEGMLIPKNASVLVRRVPGLPRKTIVIAPVSQKEGPTVENNSDDAVKGSISGTGASSMTNAEDIDWDEFGDDPYATPQTAPFQSSIQDAPPVSKEDEDSKIKALVNTPALDCQPSNVVGPGKGFGREKSGRVMGGRGFGRSGFDQKTPPQGYICHRCKEPGHFIQHCPTNGDPTYDIKRVKPPTGIPRSMLIASPDGSYTLPSGAVAVLKPNEAVFDKEMEGMPSTRSVVDLPPELHCPLCKQGMKDAVFASKCCFSSYCDKCIRDHIISKSVCVCGASNILADDLLPNKTLRDTIKRILESNNGSSGSSGITFQVQDVESGNPKANVPSPTKSAASRGQQLPPTTPSPKKKESSTDEENKAANANALQKQEKPISPKIPDVSEVTNKPESVKEEPLPESTRLAESGEGGKKKKRKKTHIPPSAQDLAHENYPCAYSPYWNGVQPGFDAFMPPPYSGHMPYTGYGFSPIDVSFGCMLPYQSDDLAMGFDGDLKRKRGMEGHEERQLFKNKDYGREDVSPVKSESVCIFFIQLLLLFICNIMEIFGNNFSLLILDRGYIFSFLLPNYFVINISSRI
ncbi:hypothetical protein ACJIZ3_004142 [Penstemon smallii]|uniref:DWNN domain-containing protein n=1 Tax=Penstemon smallii TaxID=265156 RepID=A0ABD3S1C6_9LAMI